MRMCLRAHARTYARTDGRTTEQLMPHAPTDVRTASMLASSPIITKQLMPHHNPFHCPCPFMLNSSILFYMLSALPQHALRCFSAC